MSDAKTESPVAAADAGAQEADESLPIDWSTEPVPAYANGAQIAHTPREFSMIFTELAPFPGRRAEFNVPGKERAAIVGSVRMTPDVFFQMLCVFASNWNKFANELIDPRMRRPRFKLLDAGDVQLDGVPKPKVSDD
jgi:hypothetical protein